MKFFPLEQIYIVDGNSFIKEPWVEIERLEEFLGIPHEVGSQNFYFNETKGFFCGKETIQNFNSDWTCTRNKCLSKSKGRAKLVVKDDIMRRLYTFFDPYNQLFFSLVNRTNFKWEYKP
ncbi:heparan sulfate glucosamine 3-O-sulfotransferase 1 [Eurytemora carolleeae]|uniref:heparan sulfate glucosamine 3-O-sulfotransferase 1 n=1 Tax=Eurytemora carolleeae TaxID=1294199 RepID=UPI000C75B04A|nr:heparan sulfate glucosamine 3-O-sulfotransferase 1 [Eurytemora carolleeae]|eukprot:XP_023335914.1 heparan sulfate glucosamine 3-O-sulfotransferase 1-like [Eurytemora affinis]